MKFLILCNDSTGITDFRMELLEELLNHGEVVVSTPDNGTVQKIVQVGCKFVETHINRRGINPIADWKLFSRYKSLLKAEKPDLVITYTIKPNVYAGFACRLLGIPYAANITGLGTAFQTRGPLRALVTVMYRAALRKAKTVFFQNCDNMQTLLDAKIVRQTQCFLLSGSGVNLEHFPLSAYPPEDEETRFLFMGRVMREKGVDELFAAMRQLRAEGIACSLDGLGNYEEDYSEAIAQYQAEGWLHYHGYQQDVRPFIADCHCFVLPSWHEGMANTNLECAAMGRPVITSKIHGCLEAVEEGVSGLLCQPKDAADLARVMRTFAELPHAQKAAMGSAGRKRMEDVFDKRKVVAATVARLQESVPFSETI